jgi:hypothetical protein
VLEVLKRALKEHSHEKLQKLPAWFACGDDITLTGLQLGNDAQLLNAIATYDKRLGTLAYIPTALIEWLRTLDWNGSKAMHNAVLEVQHLLAKTAHKAWIERCTVFEQQWRDKCKRQEEQRKRDNEATTTHHTTPATTAAAAPASSAPAQRETRQNKDPTNNRIETTTDAAAAAAVIRQRTSVSGYTAVNGQQRLQSNTHAQAAIGERETRKRIWIDLDAPR